ncbi:MAG: undecaprenyl-diphosphate phosphatase [Brevinema sp.]
MLWMLIFIAVVQGITEFLPVSSSGHLGIVAYFFQFYTPETLLFFLVVHAGTACAALYFFREDILNILIGFKDFFQRKDTPQKNDAFQWTLLIITVSIPTAIVGILFKDFIEGIPEYFPMIIPVMLMVTAFILLLTKFVKTNNKGLHDFTYKHAFVVGLAQSFALFPGISRSGSTIAAALLMGATPFFAGKLSFLASFVAIFGALLLEVLSFLKDGMIGLPLYYFAIGFVVAFLVGLWSLKFLIKILNNGKIYFFSIYCFVVGLSLLIFHLVK